MEAAQLLLDAGAEVNLTTYLEATPLHFCLSALGGFNESNPELFNYGPLTGRKWLNNSYMFRPKVRAGSVKTTTGEKGCETFWPLCIPNTRGAKEDPVHVARRSLLTLCRSSKKPDDSTSSSPSEGSPTDSPLHSRSPSPSPRASPLVSPRTPSLPETPFAVGKDSNLLAEWNSKLPLKSSLSKLLMLISILYKAGKITRTERGILKDQALQGNSNLETTLSAFEGTLDFEQLTATLKTIAKENASTSEGMLSFYHKPTSSAASLQKTSLFSSPQKVDLPEKKKIRTQYSNPNFGLNWQQQGTVLILDSPEIPPGYKVIAFDMVCLFCSLLTAAGWHFDPTKEW